VSVPFLVVLTAVCIQACAGDDDAGACVISMDCGDGRSCVDGRCVAAHDGGGVDAGPADAGCHCSAGEVCDTGACHAVCGDPTSLACDGDDVCDFATGRCAAAGTPGILTGEGERCGSAGPSCLPGTECSLGGRCQPAPPCYAVECSDDGQTCWGRSCLTERPPGACSPAPLERMNMPDFIGGGDGGAVDLELDDACNAYIVTTISGPDYLRQLSPAGELTVWTGVTNLNMGEVAVLRRPGDEFGVGDGLGEVALTYICCASCGCVSADPQGVARLDRSGAESLPMVVAATPSPGAGPFADPRIDTGPYGLTWGRDDRLYVGNVTGQGDLVRADLSTGTSAEIHRLAGRIHAAGTFDETSLLVAIAGGDILRVHTDDLTEIPWASVGEDVTSLVRDPFTGHVYVAVASGRILEHTARGEPIGELAASGSPGRLALSPDGYLYQTTVAFLLVPMITRHTLPDRL